MEFQFALSDFRGFHHPKFVRIAPLTLLVGENSAGKSSFLAGLKFLYDFLSGEEQPSFNKGPFQLGTFQQIAHYRGGQYGRAKSFTMAVRKQVGAPAASGERLSRERVMVEYTVTFGNQDSAAQIAELEIAAGGQRLRATLDSENYNLELRDRGNVTHALQGSTGLPRVARRDISQYWPFLLRDLRFRLSRGGVKDAEPTLFPDAIQPAVSFLANLGERLSRDFAGDVVATSPIRTKPYRTYTPGQETEDGEGSHVPYELAKLYRNRSKDGWRRAKAAIESYGRASRMFTDISVKSFGSSASDPFQIQFSSSGPKTNIVDIGYGASQVLPILYLVAMGRRSTTYLVQQPEVHLHPKAQAALGQYFVDNAASSNKSFVLETHSDFIVDRVRAAVAKGVVPASNVSILFFSRQRLENVIAEIGVDSSGELVDSPPDYREFFLDEQLRLLGVD